MLRETVTLKWRETLTLRCDVDADFELTLRCDVDADLEALKSKMSSTRRPTKKGLDNGNTIYRPPASDR